MGCTYISAARSPKEAIECFRQHKRGEVAVFEIVDWCWKVKTLAHGGFHVKVNLIPPQHLRLVDADEFQDEQPQPREAHYSSPSASQPHRGHSASPSRSSFERVPASKD